MMNTAHNPSWYISPDSQPLEGDVLFPVTIRPSQTQAAA